MKMFGLAAAIALCSIDPTVVPEHSLTRYSGEFLLGVMIGMPLYLISRAGRLTGTLIDAGRGQNMGELVNPFYKGGSQATALIIEGYALVQLFALGIGVEVYGSLLRSIKILPLGQVTSEVLLERGGDLALTISSLFATATVMFLSLATLLLAVDVIYAALCKTVPGINANNELYLVKLLTSGALLWSLVDSPATPLHLTEYVAGMLYE